MIKTNIAIIGGGPAGLAAAIAAHNKGIKDIILFERDKELGGILNQCIHDGFGLHKFKTRLTGPEYAGRYIDEIKKTQVDIRLNHMVTNISDDLAITLVNEDRGAYKVQAKAIVLAMGCRERPRGALNIPGSRPAGIYTAGTVQKLVNMEGKLPGKNIVILGSGDIGLIMARRMTLEGANVKAVCEMMPYSSGLTRNVVQCLNDFNIPLKLSHTVTRILGDKRIEGVEISRLDQNLKPIPGSEEIMECDTLILSVGLIPENDIIFGVNMTMNQFTGGPMIDNNLMTDKPGIFSCGNCLHVHDLVDYVSEESTLAGERAAEFVLKEKLPQQEKIPLKCGENVRYIVPGYITKESIEPVTVMFRVTKPMNDCRISIYCDDIQLMAAKRQRCTPGESERITLSKERVRTILEKGSITVSVSE
ncbi:MAG TPA: pyridine nucleotide-disulfide oxidoreductase [Clostridiales bacterium]|nr:pyridine nucleotide-disulfide oxidoreductase [Clostridiales bacterium]